MYKRLHHGIAWQTNQAIATQHIAKHVTSTHTHTHQASRRHAAKQVETNLSVAIHTMTTHTCASILMGALLVRQLLISSNFDKTKLALIGETTIELSEAHGFSHQ